MRIGIDIGGTKIDAVALNADLSIIHRTRRATKRGNDEIIDAIERAVNTLLEATTGLQVEQIGIGIPGVIDHDAGRVSHAVNLGVTDLELTAALTSRLGIPVIIDNDVNAAALGAVRLLGLTKPTSYLNLGTGLAAGTVIDGQIWRGARGGAGEIGHIPADSTGPLCPCGQRGCLETLASGSAIARLWPSVSEYPVIDLFDHADAGNLHAIAARTVFVEAVASATRVLFLATDVETVIIGGGLSNLGDRLLQPVHHTFRQWAEESPFLASLHLDERTIILPTGAPAAAIGAALLDAPPITATV